MMNMSTSVLLIILFCIIYCFVDNAIAAYSGNLVEDTDNSIYKINRRLEQTRRKKNKVNPYKAALQGWANSLTDEGLSIIYFLSNPTYQYI